MKPRRRTIVLVVLLIAALAGVVSTRFWGNSAARPDSAKPTPTDHSKLVDDQPMLTAQRLATLALTPEEQDFAQESLRLADHQLDLAIASALRAATLHPAPPTPAVREILGRIAEIQEQMKPQQDDIARLKLLLPKAEESRKHIWEVHVKVVQLPDKRIQREVKVTQQEKIVGKSISRSWKP